MLTEGSGVCVGCVCGEHYITHHNDENELTDVSLGNLTVFTKHVSINMEFQEGHRYEWHYEPQC